MGTFNFMAPVETWRQLKEIAHERGVTVSRIIREAIDLWLEREGLA